MFIHLFTKIAMHHNFLTFFLYGQPLSPPPVSPTRASQPPYSLKSQTIKLSNLISVTHNGMVIQCHQTSRTVVCTLILLT